MRSSLRSLTCRCLLLPACCALLDGCGTPTDADAAASSGGGSGSGGLVSATYLLSMTWAEAQKLSPRHLEVPPYYKVAADEIQVLKRDAAARPMRVHAKGHVFVQVDFSEQLVALAQEAYLESGGELIMRGKPLLKRGRSVVEGLTDMTVFYAQGTRLQVVGQHRLTRQRGADASFEVKPTWTRSWKEGPNPLLPALSPEDVPKEMRVNPLLPPLDGGGLPKTLPSESLKPEPSSGLPAPTAETPRG